MTEALRHTKAVVRSDNKSSWRIIEDDETSLSGQQPENDSRRVLFAIPLWIGYGRERCKAVPCQRMRYYPREASLFWVEVVISKAGHIETRKYRENNWYGRLLVRIPRGPWFTRRSWACSSMNRPTSGDDQTERHLVEQAGLG
jgi:hypothetical protein